MRRIARARADILAAPDCVLVNSVVGILRDRAAGKLVVGPRLVGFRCLESVPELPKLMPRRGYPEAAVRGVLGDHVLPACRAVWRLRGYTPPTDERVAKGTPPCRPNRRARTEPTGPR